MRTIAGPILVLVTGVRLLLGPNQLGILDWLVLSCVLIVVVNHVLRRLDPPRRFVERIRQEREAERLRTIRNFQTSPFFTPTDYDDKSITLGFGIKQNLKVKRFVGRSKNAVLSQLWVATCMYLLLAYLKFVLRLGWSLHRTLRVLQLNLFDRRPLVELFTTPSPPGSPDPQMLLWC